MSTTSSKIYNGFDWKRFKPTKFGKPLQNHALVYKLCKKITQLTKIISNLHRKNDELELHIQVTTADFQEKLTLKSNELQRKCVQFDSTKQELSEIQKSVSLHLHEKQHLISDLQNTKSGMEKREKLLIQEFKLKVAEIQQFSTNLENKLQTATLALEHSVKNYEETIKTLKHSHSQEINQLSNNYKIKSESLCRKHLNDITKLQEDSGKIVEEKLQMNQKEIEKQVENLKIELDKVQEELRNKDTMQNDEKTKSRKELLEQEGRHRNQLEEIEKKFIKKSQESESLSEELAEVKKELNSKTEQIEDFSCQLSRAHGESQSALKRLELMEEEMDIFKKKNLDLTNDIMTKTSHVDTKTVTQEEVDKIRVECEEKIKELETKIKQIEEEKTTLANEKTKIEEERDEEIRLIQEALEEAIEDSDATQEKFDKEFEHLRNVNTDREQHLLDDFEWKLREIQQNCKKKLEEKDKKMEDMLKNARQTVETELKSQLQRITDEKKMLESKMKEVTQLPTLKAEVNKLKALTSEQQRSLIGTTKEVEELKSTESSLKEEVDKLKALLDREKNHLYFVQSNNKRRIEECEDNHNSKLEQQKNELNAEWEDKLREERTRLKSELDQLHEEEKHLAVETMKVQKEQEISSARQLWEHKENTHMEEIAKLRDDVACIENKLQRETEVLRTNADSDTWGLRRKLEKLDMTYQEQIDKMKEEHVEEIERIKDDYKLTIAQYEKNFHKQITGNRTTLELVKEQVKNESSETIRRLQENHISDLERQRYEIEEEKADLIRDLEKHYKEQINLIQNEMEEIIKLSQKKEGHLISKLESLQNQKTDSVACKTENPQDIDASVQLLNQEIQARNQELLRVQREANQKSRSRDPCRVS